MPVPPTNDDDVTGTLARSALFAGVPPSLVAEASARCDAVILAVHERLPPAGLRDRLYLIASGTLQVRAHGTGDDGALMGPGECVGGRALVGGGPVPTDVIAREPSALVAFDEAALWTLVDASPEFARNLLRILAGREREGSATAGECARVVDLDAEASTVDSVTGLPNRRWMEDAFKRQIERSTRTAQAASILVLDVDHYAALCAQHGQRVSDALLRRTADVLARALRPDDLLSRCGSGTFAVLLPGFDAQATISLAERLRAAVGTAGEPGDGLPTVTVSIGGTTRRPFETLAELLKRAEDALQHAQQTDSRRTP